MAIILIVDDYSDIRACLRTMLEEAGHIIVEAGSGQEALWPGGKPTQIS